MFKHPFRDSRHVALRKVGQLFALVDRAVGRGQLGEAKNLLAELRTALAETQRYDVGHEKLRRDAREGNRFQASSVRRIPEPAIDLRKVGTSRQR